MASEDSRINEDGSIHIPATYREAMGLQKGDVVFLSMDEDGLHIKNLRQAIRHSQALIRSFIDPSRSLSDELIAERRLEAARELDE